MEKRKQEEFTTISLKKEDCKKLNDYKDYGSEPLWRVIKRLIEKKEEK